MSKWISVKDRLPVDNKTVLLSRDGIHYLGFYSDGRFWCVPPSPKFYYDIHGITHWLPIPTDDVYETLRSALDFISHLPSIGIVGLAILEKGKEVLNDVDKC